MIKKHKHAWILGGPWYRWKSEEDPGWGPTSRPIFQKYGNPDFVNNFLENPQRSLLFDKKDVVRSISSHAKPTKLPIGLSGGKTVEPNRRKIFLATHSRFYLVVCELHCDAAGFPNVPHADVCEAGFVVRRRKAPIPKAARPAVEAALREIVGARTRLAKLGLVPVENVKTDDVCEVKPIGNAIQEVRNHKGKKIQATYDKSKQELAELVQQHGIKLSSQIWVPSDTKGDGDWTNLGPQPEAEMPQEIVEQIFPLYPLIPDPAATNHPSRGRSIWFGMLPTGSSDVDGVGNPRFDDRHVYEARCFVRQHIPGCPKSSERRDCSGELVWSRSTNSYQLASHFDLDGTSNKLVTIQMPDINALQAQLADPDFQIGDGVGVALVSPADSELEFGVDDDGNPTNPGMATNPSICFFAIPLITIVATFLLRLILPIVVFVFGLWFLLRLKFCILPSVSLDAGVAVDLEAELELGVDVTFEAEIEAALGIQGSFATGLSKDDYRELARATLDQTVDFSTDAPAELVSQMDRPQPPGKFASTAGTLSGRNTLAYYQTVVEVPAR